MLTAIVTGGSRGIGRAIVERLAHDGFRVVFVYRQDDCAAGTVERVVAEAGGVAVARRCDLRDPDQTAEFVRSVESEPIFAMIHNAAMLHDGHLLLMREESWQGVVDTTLTAMYRLTRGCLRPMLERQQGRVVAIGSLSASLGQAGQTNYAAAKSGLIGFVRALARELGRFGITANAVIPGWIDTDLTRALTERRRATALGTVPAGRFGEPAEVAAAVSFLLSPGAGYITGTSLRVDGGVGA